MRLHCGVRAAPEADVGSIACGRASRHRLRAQPQQRSSIAASGTRLAWCNAARRASGASLCRASLRFARVCRALPPAPHALQSRTWPPLCMQCRPSCPQAPCTSTAGRPRLKLRQCAAFLPMSSALPLEALLGRLEAVTGDRGRPGRCRAQPTRFVAHVTPASHHLSIDGCGRSTTIDR